MYQVATLDTTLPVASLQDQFNNTVLYVTTTVRLALAQLPLVQHVLRTSSYLPEPISVALVAHRKSIYKI